MESAVSHAWHATNDRHSPRPLQRARVVPNAIFATMVFVFTEVMFFAALISAYLVIFSRQKSNWAPPTGVRLPVEVTALNTGILIASGLLLLSARVPGATGGGAISRSRVWASAILGAAFVAIQGGEWIRLLKYGMNIHSGTFSSLFFLLVGSHAAHAVAGVLVLVWLARTLTGERPERDAEVVHATQLFWGAIVAIWPVIYLLVYL